MSGFTIPFMALSAGYDGDSKLTAAQSRPVAAPAPVVPQATPTAPK